MPGAPSPTEPRDPLSHAAHDTEPCWRFSTLVGRIFLKLIGWRVVGELPPDRHMLIVAAPHTSNLDGFIMLAAAWHLGVHMRWLVKETLFVPGIAWALRASGAIPVNRAGPGGLVESLAARFAETPALTLVIPPTGTRSRREYWRSGFYHVARAANVPVVLAFADYGTRRTGVGPTLRLTGDIRADMDVIRAFYAPIQARFPLQSGPSRLKEEAE